MFWLGLRLSCTRVKPPWAGWVAWRAWGPTIGRARGGGSLRALGRARAAFLASGGGGGAGGREIHIWPPAPARARLGAARMAPPRPSKSWLAACNGPRRGALPRSAPARPLLVPPRPVQGKTRRRAFSPHVSPPPLFLLPLLPAPLSGRLLDLPRRRLRGGAPHHAMRLPPSRARGVPGPVAAALGGDEVRQGDAAGGGGEFFPYFGPRGQKKWGTEIGLAGPAGRPARSLPTLAPCQCVAVPR